MPDHDGRQGQRQLHFEQHLGRAGAERLGGFDQIRRYLLDAENGQSHDGRQGEDNGDHDAGHITNPE